MSPSSVESLTTKQRRAYDLLTGGKSPDEAAVKMGITRQGVYQHMKKIRKLGLSLPGDEPAQPTPPAEPAAPPAPVSSNGHAADPEAALRAAIEKNNAEIAVLEERNEKYEAALAVLT